MLGLGAEDDDYWHTIVRTNTFIQLAQVFNNRQEQRNQDILSRWTHFLNWTEPRTRRDGTTEMVRYSYGNMENYIRTMFQPATEGPENYYHWGNLVDLFPAAAAIGRTVIVLYRYGIPGHEEQWAYQVADADFDFNNIYNPDLSVDYDQMQQVICLNNSNKHKN
jgi:hypothetical protein